MTTPKTPKGYNYSPTRAAQLLSDAAKYYAEALAAEATNAAANRNVYHAADNFLCRAKRAQEAASTFQDANKALAYATDEAEKALAALEKAKEEAKE